MLTKSYGRLFLSERGGSADRYLGYGQNICIVKIYKYNKIDTAASCGATVMRVFNKGVPQNFTGIG